LRIAGSDGREIFDAAALAAIHRSAAGIPRVINLLCEHCLVSAFVDQQKVIGPAVVEAVARDFDLEDGPASGEMAHPEQTTEAVKFDVADALRSLATLAERLRHEEKDLPDQRKL
jgi:hypothetical protein